MEDLKLKLDEMAIKYFAGSSIYGLMNEKIYLIHDDTLFGSAKDGMALGERRIYWRERFSSPEKLSYSEIVESTANKNKKI